MNKEDICRFICQELPKHHLQNMLEGVEAAFNKSASDLKANYQRVPLAGPGPQSHHFMVQEALLSLTDDANFEVRNCSTRPAGGHYALIQAGVLQITTSVVAIDRKPPIRDAGFRLGLSLKNAKLEEQHPDLFEAPVEAFGPQENALHVLFLPYTAKWISGNDHSFPLGYIVAVPYSNDLTRFHLRVDVNELWQHYDEDEADGLRDIAYPTLRDRMRGAESDDQTEEGGNG